MERLHTFPFLAIEGQEKAKKALILAFINPKIGGLLLMGQKGTAKSTLVRAATPFMTRDQSFIELPLNTSEEQAIGGLKMDKVTLTGEKHVQVGLLARANRNILYIDEINLLSGDVLTHVMDAQSAKEVHLEREGIGDVFASDFTLIGTMNPEEGALSAKCLDRFGMSVSMEAEQDLHVRKQIVTSRLAYDDNPVTYTEQFKSETKILKETIEKARKQLSQVVVPEDMWKVAVSLAVQACCEGHRADFTLIEVAKANCAYRGEITVTIDDLQEAAQYVLPHRMREMPQEQQNEPSPQQEGPDQEQAENPPESNEPEQPEQDMGGQPEMDEGESEQPPSEPDSDEQDGGEGQSETKDQTESAAGVIDLSLIEPMQKGQVKQQAGTGKRNKSRTNLKSGRHVKSIKPKGKAEDISFSATLRAAAPYQRFRKKDGKAIAIHSSDLHVKIREKRTGHTILFLIDASGSMGVKQRMRTVKSAILSLLQEAYEKRDKVGLVTFAKDEANVLLEPTRSVVRAESELQSMPTGGNTPLVLGLEKAYQKLSHYKQKDPDYSPFLVFVTDGRANTKGDRKTNWQNALKTCRMIREMDVNSMVVDTEQGLVQLGLAKELAESLDSSYYKMAQVQSDELVDLIRGRLS